MANLGSVGMGGTVGAAGVGSPSGGASTISAATRVVLSLGTWLGIYTPSTTVPAQITFEVEPSQLIFP